MNYRHYNFLEPVLVHAPNLVPVYVSSSHLVRRVSIQCNLASQIDNMAEIRHAAEPGQMLCV